jgi:hypothetical protein
VSSSTSPCSKSSHQDPDDSGCSCLLSQASQMHCLWHHEHLTPSSPIYPKCLQIFEASIRIGLAEWGPPVWQCSRCTWVCCCPIHFCEGGECFYAQAEIPRRQTALVKPSGDTHQGIKFDILPALATMATLSPSATDFSNTEVPTLMGGCHNFPRSSLEVGRASFLAPRPKYFCER